MLVLGDSVAARVWSGMNPLLSDKFELLQLSPSNCRPGFGWGEGYCKQSNSAVFKHINNNKYDLIIVASLGLDNKNFIRTKNFLEEINQPTVYIGLPFVFRERLPNYIFKHAENLNEINSIKRHSILALNDNYFK